MEVTDEPTVRSGSRFLYRHQLKLEALQPVVHVPTAFDVAASRAGVRSGLDRRPDDVRVEDLRHQFQLARRPALVVKTCHGVHVLLRHRPPSIALSLFVQGSSVETRESKVSDVPELVAVGLEAALRAVRGELIRARADGEGSGT